LADALYLPFCAALTTSESKYRKKRNGIHNALAAFSIAIGFSLALSEHDTKQVISYASRIFEDEDYWVIGPDKFEFQNKKKVC
jgi:hypothetical protein